MTGRVRSLRELSRFFLSCIGRWLIKPTVRYFGASGANDVALGGLVYVLIGRWVSPVRGDQTRAIVKNHLWMLTGSDRTPGGVRPVISEQRVRSRLEPYWK